MNENYLSGLSFFPLSITYKFWAFFLPKSESRSTVVTVFSRVRSRRNRNICISDSQSLLHLVGQAGKLHVHLHLEMHIMQFPISRIFTIFYPLPGPT